MKVFDCFLFFNELDLLEIRLNILKDKVDKFVLVEQSTTHQGKPKESVYLQNKQRFSWINDKIIHIICDGDIVLGECSSEQAMANEYKQRNALSIVTTIASQEDLLMFSDIDEIPDISNIPNTPSISFCKNYCYNFNTMILQGDQFYVNWRGTIFLNTSHLINKTVQNWRDSRVHLPKGSEGWHFSYFGGSEHIKTKLRSFSHPEVNIELSTKNLEKHIKEGSDFLAWFRNIPLSRVSDEDARLPLYVLENKEKYKNLFYN